MKPVKKIGVILMPRIDDTINVLPSMRFPMVIAQCFGFFPVDGLKHPNYKSLKFSYASLKFLYSLTTLSVVSFVVVAELHKMIVKGYNLYELNGLMFNLCGVISCLLFIKLAKDWPQLMQSWHEVEMKAKSVGVSTNLKRRLKIVTLIFIAVAAVEHALVQSYKLVTIFRCTRTVSEGFQHFFVNATDSHIFGIVDYALWKGLIFQMSIVQITFCWTFNDVFIILISIAFWLRVNQVANKLQMIIRSKTDAIVIWRNIREEHYRLCELCSLLDRKISYIVLLSYWTNLYFTLVQLFSTLRDMKNSLEKSYFFISFFFLIMRLICVCLFGASIHDENKKILPILLSVPASIYNFEVKRFTEQVIYANIAISGRKFFIITKGLILKIAGAIVTYELVLIQFNAHLLDETATNEEVPTVHLNSSTYWLC